jgi:starch phosphorylase
MEQVGEENIFIFGATAPQVADIRAHGYQPRQLYETNPELRQVLDQVRDGAFSPDEPARFQRLFDLLVNFGDHYLLLADFASYMEAQDQVDALYRQPEAWTRKAILNVAGMGVFSSDRTITEYAREVWHAEPLKFKA